MGFKPFRPPLARVRTSSDVLVQDSAGKNYTPPAKRRRVSNSEHNSTRKANDGQGLHGGKNQRSPLSPIKNVTVSSEPSLGGIEPQETYYTVLW